VQHRLQVDDAEDDVVDVERAEHGRDAKSRLAQFIGPPRRSLISERSAD
jgi:hypothetical protein